MISGGAALNPQVALNFARLGIPILQGWGMTEASPVLSVQRWNPRRFYMSNYYEEPRRHRRAAAGWRRDRR